jgi:F-type H+-transporting ATPase subunit delta
MSSTDTASTQPTEISGVALTYARALLGAAKTAGNVESVAEEFSAFISQVWDRVPNLAGVLRSGLVSSDDKASVLTKAIGGQLSNTLNNFLMVVANHDRLGALPQIEQGLRQLIDAERGVVRVNVSTATALEGDQVSKLQSQLQQVLGGIPILDNTIDPTIIGGFVLRVGDKVYDASLSTQLEQLRQQMITRSIHEIQSRRDRFCITEGN